VGRFKTPFGYEWYRVHIWDLLAPERSLFGTNYPGQRRFGLMAQGSLMEQTVEYAVGTFNTQRNSYQPFGNRQDVMAFLNFKPFYNWEEGFLLRDLQFGGSVDAGNQNQSAVPAALRTNGAASGTAADSTAASNAATLPFLAFNSGVVERGDRALWELHAAYYRGGLSLMGAWQGGYESYATGPNAPQTRVPIHGWFAQAGYLVTGETVRDRTLVQPLRPFDLRSGRFGLGAFEPTARYSDLRLDPVVFTSGLVDSSRWTNRAQLIDVGCNWYLSKFVKVYAGWEHAVFATPVVLSAPGNSQKSSDLFWLRTQVYF
jgi:phosphate-selective porin OprO/OprP